MASRARDYIQARPVHQSHMALGEALFYHAKFSGFAAEPHAHAGMQLVLPLAGRMRLVTKRQEELLGPEWAVLIPPGEEHAFTHLDGELEFLAIDAPGERLAAWAEAVGMPAPDWDGRLRVVRDGRLFLAARQLADELDAPQPGAAPLLEAGLTTLGIYVMRALARGQEAPVVSEPRVMRAVDRILRDYPEPLSVEDLAAELAMSPRHFERCFKQAVGHAPRKFLIEVRIGAARMLLSESAMPITRVALEVGFKTPSHFAETFQRSVGMTPSAYRAAQQGA